MVNCIRVESNGDIRVPFEFAAFENDPAAATPGIAEVRDEETGEITTPSTRGGDGWLHPNKGRWAVFVDEPTSFNSLTHTRSRAMPTNVASGPVVVEYAVTARPLADVKADRIAALASHRYDREIAGFTLGGMGIATDERSARLIQGAYTAAKSGLATSLRWKAPGGFVTLNAEQIIAIGEALFAFVQACFDNEDAHTTDINALNTVAAVAAYDITTGWPT